MSHPLRALLLAASLAFPGTFLQADEPPAGFTALFHGRDLACWRGRPQLDPQKEAETPAEERGRLQAEWNRDLAEHWTVKDGVIINDGKGVYLTTGRDYADFELLLDWRLPEPCVDSGVY
ncbi:MAG: family 16 glycoside hydrolase, partial [Planctomycetia bacterium]